MKKSSLLYKIINGIWDMCYIWKTEMRNVFRDEGVLIFCILVPLGYPLLYSWQQHVAVCSSFRSFSSSLISSDYWAWRCVRRGQTSAPSSWRYR